MHSIQSEYFTSLILYLYVVLVGEQFETGTLIPSEYSIPALLHREVFEHGPCDVRPVAAAQRLSSQQLFTGRTGQQLGAKQTAWQKNRNSPAEI